MENTTPTNAKSGVATMPTFAEIRESKIRDAQRWVAQEARKVPAAVYLPGDCRLREALSTLDQAYALREEGEDSGVKG